MSRLDEVYINGSLEHRLPGNLNISFNFVEGEGLMMAIKDVAVSSGSACTSASLEPSYVLRALGVGDELAHSSIRFGLGRFNTEEEVDYVADLVVGEGQAPARPVAALGDAQGRHRPEERPVGSALSSHREQRTGPHSSQGTRKRPPWHTATKSSSTTRTRATSARSTRSDPNVGTGLVGAPACGDVMRLQIKVNDQGVIEDAKFKTFGCGSAIASSSLATEWIKGKTVDEAETIKNSQIVEELNLPPVKIHCSVLAEDAIKSAIADYRKKQARRGAPSPPTATARSEHGDDAGAAGDGARAARGQGAASLAVAAKAVDAIARQLQKRGTPEASLRLGIRGGGCSGFTYVIEFHDGPPARARSRLRLRRERRDARCASSSTRRASST